MLIRKTGCSRLRSSRSWKPLSRKYLSTGNSKKTDPPAVETVVESVVETEDKNTKWKKRWEVQQTPSLGLRLSTGKCPSFPRTSGPWVGKECHNKSRIPFVSFPSIHVFNGHVGRSENHAPPRPRRKVSSGNVSQLNRGVINIVRCQRKKKRKDESGNNSMRHELDYVQHYRCDSHLPGVTDLLSSPQLPTVALPASR